MSNSRCPIQGGTGTVFCSASINGACKYGFTSVARDGTCRKKRVKAERKEPTK
jgi:hypothetical protein